METLHLLTNQVRSEEEFRSTEASRTNLQREDNSMSAGTCILQLSSQLKYLKTTAIRQCVLLFVNRVHSLLLLRVGRQVTGPLLDRSDNLKLCRSVEIVSLLTQKQPQVASNITASNICAHDAVRHSETLIDGHGMGHPVPRVQHHTSGAASGITVIERNKASQLNKCTKICQFSYESY